MQWIDLFHNLVDVLIYFLAGAVAAFYYYERKRRAILGGFWGGALIGGVGAVIVSMIAGLDAWFIRLVTWLMQPKIGDDFLFRVNLITALIGAVLFVYILNRINHDRERPKK